jgi:hypothetical protein
MTATSSSRAWRARRRRRRRRARPREKRSAVDLIRKEDVGDGGGATGGRVRPLQTPSAQLS